MKITENGRQVMIGKLDEQKSVFGHDEIRRYSRHLIMPEIGMDGQKKLKEARVLCVGAGGLGSPLSMYLAAAGVGHIGIVDFDVVDESNLQRQILHGTSTIGWKKLESAKQRLLDLNPHIEIITYEEPLTSANALTILQDYDVIADGTDNFPTRYLVNDACVLLGKPNVYGSIFRFGGQASVFYAKEGPCYRCLYPDPPPPGLVPSCAEGGVLGVLPGVIGTIQATEVIKLVVGYGNPLIGRLLLYDAATMEFSTLKLRKDPACVLCSDHPSLTTLIDYEQFCSITHQDGEKVQDLEISVGDLQREIEQKGQELVIIDVREPHEWVISHLPQAQLIPKDSLPTHLKDLDPTREYILHCKGGVRSLEAVKLMKAAGFHARSLHGGINAWAREIDPSLPTY